MGTIQDTQLDIHVLQKLTNQKGILWGLRILDELRAYSPEQSTRQATLVKILQDSLARAYYRARPTMEQLELINVWEAPDGVVMINLTKKGIDLNAALRIVAKVLRGQEIDSSP